jgi:hypothetical protein
MASSMSPCLLLPLSCSLLSFDHRAARIAAAVRADHVRRLHRAALGAGLKLLRFKAVVRTPHAGSRVRLFAFGNTHGNTCLKALLQILVDPIA